MTDQPKPTLDAAEGAGDLRKDINLIWATLDRAAMASRSHRVPPQVTRALNRIEAALDEAAPPKPAPDAVRSLLITAKLLQKACDGATFGGETWLQDTQSVINSAEAFFSAPVPSPDGAREWGSHVWMAWCKDKGFEPDAVWKKEPSAIVKQMQEKAGWQIVRVEIRKFSPSGTGVAEPVAVCPSCGWRFHPEVATPSVRGNREAIARAIFKNRQHLSDEDVDRWFKIYADKPEGVDHFRMAIWRAYSDADAILSLPVQSTAR